MYLTAVIDLFDRKVIAWALSTTITERNTNISTLRVALASRPITKNSPRVFHSDHGIQYACAEFVREIGSHNSVTRSMSENGNCWDNVMGLSPNYETQLSVFKT
ncbi:DDE-type integrase/transposase/recombinase [Flavobacterium sinopsychrotolerans]|uniref:DDE-type integrase/transposase/recombinase n=1 Tax=Flavobacterium sinopsychrotolerans TaxID=604089 RepID=UPI0037BE27CE